MIRSQKLNNKLKVLLLAISFVFGGIILGGVPNVVLVIQHIFADFLFPNRWAFLLLRLSIFLGLTFFFGRIFCGYVCPLGAVQELASMIRFKPKLNYNRTYKKKKTYLRWGFFAIYAIFSMIWGLELTLFMNPINGFLIFWTPLTVSIFVAFIIFMLTIVVSFFIYRPYCRFFCPFGALAFLFGKISPLKIRRTPHCTECGVCEKICPTLEGFRKSKKGVCYLCYRCMEFCSNEMFIDPQKIAEIKRYLSTFTLNFDVLPKEKFLNKTIKIIVQLFVPKKRMRYFNEFIDALEGKSKFFTETIQNIVVRLREIFSDEVINIDRKSFEAWIKENEPRWKEKIQPIHLDKLIYGLSK